MPTVSHVFRLSLIGCASLALAMGVGRFAFTPLLPMMREEKLLTISEGGVVASVHFIGYLMGALVAAKLPLPPLMAMRLSLLAIAIATLSMGFVNDVAAWTILRWIAGVCSAWVLVLVSNFIIRRLAEIGWPAVQGVVFSGVGAGIMLVGLACLGFMTGGTRSIVGWQIAGGTSLLVAIALCLSLGPEVPTTRTSLRVERDGRRALVWPMIIGYGTAGLGYVIPATYLPVMAKKIVSNPFVFGWSWPVFGAAALMSTLLAAQFRRRFADRWIWATSQIIMALGVLIPVVYPTIEGMALSGLFVGGTFMVITMTGLQEVHRIAPPADVIRHLAAMTTAFATGQIIGPVLASSIYVHTGSFNLALVCTAVALAVTAAALIVRVSSLAN